MTAEVVTRRFRSNDAEPLIALWQEVLPSSQPWNEPRGVLCRKMNRNDDLVFVAERDGEILDGYMKQLAAPGYRKLLGDSMPNKMTHTANVTVGKELGLIPLAAWTSSVDEWDEFEWSYQRIVEQQAADAPDDENVVTKLARRREWMDAYLKWGRDTLGYGTYLFRKQP